MAADANRLAAALAYEDDRKRRLAESIPTLTGPTTAPRRSVRTDLENLSAGLGQGITTQLEGIKGLITDPVGTAKGAYEAARAVVRDPSVLAAALSQMGQKAMSGPLGAGEVMGEMIGPRKTGPVMAELDVYHGTPHRFPATEANPLGEFDASKIGTGEGAQTFGHGIYLTQKPEIAEYYKNTIQADPQEFVDGEPFDDLNPNHLAAFYAAQHMGNWGRFDPEEVAKFAERGVGEPHQQAAVLLRQSKFGKYTETEPGTVYKADLPDEMIDRMLDWDAPVDESVANKIINAVRKNDQLDANDFEDALGLSDSYFGQPEDGRAIYKLLADSFKSDEKASEFLNEIGISGIKYLDAGSRGQGGSGTRNFVVFPGEEKKVRILERK